MNLKCSCSECNGAEWPADQFRTFVDRTGRTRYRTRRTKCLNRDQRAYYHAHKPKPSEKLPDLPEYKARSWKVRCPTCGRPRKRFMLWAGRQKNPDGSVYVPRFRCKSCEGISEYAAPEENMAMM